MCFWIVRCLTQFGFKEHRGWDKFYDFMLLISMVAVRSVLVWRIFGMKLYSQIFPCLFLLVKRKLESGDLNDFDFSVYRMKLQYVAALDSLLKSSNQLWSPCYICWVWLHVMMLDLPLLMYHTHSLICIHSQQKDSRVQIPLL